MYGALQDPLDIRDYKYLARGSFDWKSGYDVEKEIKAKLVTKDQNGSYSCGGQAWAYYGEVLEAIATGTYEPRSARWIYSHTRAPGGGSDGRTNCHFVKTEGFVLEKHAPSYQEGKPPEERLFLVKPYLDKEAEDNRKLSKALSYLSVETDIESVACAIKENHGVVLGILGEDNGTWRSAFPKPPKKGTWRHWVYAGKVRIKDGKKQIGIKNSWGKVGEDGWQWLSEDYFDKGVWACWTLAWDYEPAKQIAALKATITALQSLISLYQKLIHTKR
jgi:hypothetical protein